MVSQLNETVSPCRWWLMALTSTRRGSIPQSSSTCSKTTTTTCWSVASSSPFSLPPWSANAWPKSNCSTGPGGKKWLSTIPSLTAPRLHEGPQPDEMRWLGNVPVEEQRSKFNKAHTELQGWGIGGVGWLMEGLLKVLSVYFLTYFASTRNNFIAKLTLCHVILMFKTWFWLKSLGFNVKTVEFGNSYTCES